VTRYVALLRGINVGGRQKVAMADLRKLLDGLGYTEVKTHLQSGNAVFSSSKRSAEKIAGEIEAAITAQLGLTVRVLVRTAAELRAVIEANPIPGEVANGSRFLVVFLSGPPDQKALAAVEPGQFEPEKFGAGDRAMYFWCPDGIQNSPILGALGKDRPGLTATARNWNTVTKLLELAETTG
jgi:uncharacterized protein (DUF1697 family)